MELYLAHLYPEYMNIYGDRGNIITIQHRCLQRNINVVIENISVGDHIDPDKYDFYFMGGGQDRQQLLVAEDLQTKQSIIKQAVENEAVFLLICGGYQLFGHYYKPFSGNELKGISVLDAYTVAGNKRFIGNVTATLKESIAGINTLVGFENHSGLTYIGNEVKPIGYVKVGNGNNGRDKTEGAVYKNVYGTYLHGSLLPKNPHFTDMLIERALSRRYTKFKLQDLNNSMELLAHKQAINRKYY